MQTFLPYLDFGKTAKCLDSKRLGKQRVEAKQILECLRGTSNQGWRHHPAVKMWKGLEHILAWYGFCICREWRERGFKDNGLLNYFANLSPPIFLLDELENHFTEGFQNSHRSNLLRKDPVHYGQFGWDVPNDLPYVWPTKESK